jgi:putative ABC transport system permease protein
METFVKIAWRNIIRNKRRSLITIFAVGFGLGALIFILSFVEGAHRQMIENYTSLTTSHIQIHRLGFYQKKKLELNLPDYRKIMEKTLRLPSVKAAAPRIKSVGLVSSTESSAGCLIMGISPEDEKQISTLYKRVRQGSYLEKGGDEDILIGASLAKNLAVQLGDKIVIMSQALDGSIAAGAFRIKGIFDTGTEEIDQGVTFITHTAAETIFVMPEATSEIAVRIDSAEKAPAVGKKIRQTVADLNFEVLSWQDISPSFRQWIEFDNAFIWIIIFIVMIVAAIGILNTVLMGVLERTREFGILLALGTKQKEIVSMVGWESFFLATVGGLVGLLIGVGATVYFSHAGLNLSLFTSALNSLYIDAIIYPQLNVSGTIMSLQLILTASLLVSIYPAYYAAHLKPMEAIRSM